MACCPNCIGDAHLRRTVFAIRGQGPGKCGYCASDGESLLEPRDLRDYFELVIGIYVESDSGRSLVEWLKEDWGLFDHPRMDVAHTKELLGDITDDGNLVRKHFVPRDIGDSTTLRQWEDFREELMHRNRYFPIGAPLDRLKTLVGYLALDVDDFGLEMYRARIQEQPQPFTFGEMGAPPAGVASNGRANPAGIPYLYVASDAGTAISELRPHVADAACVAKVNLRSGLRVADLRNPKKTASPFALEDIASVALHRKDLPFLVKLGKELSRPVRQKAAHIDYLPSQYLCEFIKSCGFDGVMYKSSVGDGVNIALFDPSAGTVASLVTHTVSSVRVEF